MVFEDKYIRQYPFIIEIAFNVIDSLEQQKVPMPDIRWRTYEKLAAKIVINSATIKHLKNGTILHLTQSGEQATKIDVSAMLMIMRSVIDAYLALSEIFFQPKDDDLFEYRWTAYEINGRKIREELLHVDSGMAYRQKPPKFVDKMREHLADLEGLRDRMKKTRTFENLDDNQKKSSLNGRMFPKREFKKRSEAAGINASYFSKFYAYASAHTHSDSLSTSQIFSSKPQIEQDLKQISLINIAILSMFIRNHLSLFPESTIVYNKYNDEIKLVVQGASQLLSSF